MDREKDGFPLTSIREINILLSVQHPNIVNVSEVVCGGGGDVYMVMDYSEHDLRALQEKQRRPFTVAQVPPHLKSPAWSVSRQVSRCVTKQKDGGTKCSP